ncbi:uncharacterized protein [Solanum tuberosum]|uniref:uncharacterized protein isoform X1 n=1 Tax=Solanum tuberosum TaxID=4113 RepID=UPI000739FA0F|nr:PREDICTED: uncharacterized protein LOC102589827 isoform X1 [Solanum tuberosum]KAH0637394.1 hypothetical protein KY289_037309 [Solanum tuberosum]
MTETRTCEFDHNNNPKKNTRSTEELKDGFSGLPYSEVEDGLSRLPCFGVEDDKGEILEDEFSGLPCSGVEDGLCGLPCFGVEDDKGGILEDGFAEKGKKKRRICEMGRLNDPLVVLGSDIMLMILSCLDARSVALCLLVSCGWRGIASSDKIWSSKCEELWQGKTHLPRIAKVNDLSKLAVYSLSIMDGKRKRIRKEDLYDHVWEFHFTEAAPEYWRMLDPYWNGTGRPLRRYFLPDGSQTAEPDDKIWGGHESCYSIVTSVLADGKIRAHYVRINRWPPMYVTRKEDWSWEISNNFCTYRSIPDADKKDGTGPLFLLH